MKVLLSFDYELYFGKHTGSQEKCMIVPTNKIMEILDRYGVKATFFVDCGYLLKLKSEKKKYPLLEADYEGVVSQLKTLNKNGHNLQLHIHPHWEDCYFDGEKWIMDTSRYRLHDFSDEEIDDIIYRYKNILEEIADNNIFAHRGGGWCIQPFDRLAKSLKKHNIWLDSTVFEGGRNSSETHYFDFKQIPKRSSWSFENDPCKENKNGFFREIPISSYKLSALFFWKLVYHKKFGRKEHENFGDGLAAGGSKWDKLRMLTRSTNSVVSVDGYKSSFLEQAFRVFSKNKENNNFVIIGHPKSMSEYSLKKLEMFIIKNRSSNFETIRSFENEF
jgi:hypothetical protein